MFFESAAPLPPAVSPAAGDIAWLQHRLGRLWQLDPIASRLDAEALQGVRGAWGAAPDSASADQKARLILSLAAVRRPVPADVLDESSSLVVDLLRDHAESSDGPLVRTAAGLLQGLCPPLCDAASLRTAPIEEQAPVLLAQAAEDLRGIAALAAERTLRAVASLPSVAGSDGRPPSLAERPLLLQELPLESRFVGIGTAAWAATAHRPGAHFAVAPTAAAARIRTLVGRTQSFAQRHAPTRLHLCHLCSEPRSTPRAPRSSASSLRVHRQLSRHRSSSHWQQRNRRLAETRRRKQPPLRLAPLSGASLRPRQPWGRLPPRC